jgi:hypothetical protein
MSAQETGWPATGRFRVTTAPGGLGLVQDLLNTLAPEGSAHRDLLADKASAQEWADATARQWAAVTGGTAPHVLVDDEALARLRAYRARFQDAALEPGAGEGSPGEAPLSGEAALELGADGQVRATPQGAGWRRLTSLLLLAAWQAQADDLRRRLKVCRNPACRVAFYDRSRNNSGVWHDVRTCGNTANLRAHRARRREEVGTSAT